MIKVPPIAFDQDRLDDILARAARRRALSDAAQSKDGAITNDEDLVTYRRLYRATIAELASIPNAEETDRMTAEAERVIHEFRSRIAAARLACVCLSCDLEKRISQFTKQLTPKPKKRKP